MTSLEEFADRDAQVSELKQSLARTQRQLARAKGKTDDLVEATLQAARDAVLSYSPPKELPAPAKDKRRKGAEVALWHLTDWQGSKLTPSYNTQVMHERVRLYVQKARHITDIQRAAHPVNDCTVVFGGDMVEGLFNFPTQAYEIDATLFDQWVNVSMLIVETVQAALSMYDTVTVVGEWGNHGRLGSKRDAVPRSDNVDRMCYEFARRLLQGEKRLTWQDSGEDIQRIEIGNYRALAIHGDEIGRNGFASTGTIVQHANKWRSGSYPWAFRDVYVGHYHTHYEAALADGLGAVYGTGSTESENRYAAVHLASSATPSQRLHFIDPDKGRVTAQYRVLLG